MDKRKLLGEYFGIFRQGKNMCHVFSNLLAALSAGERFLEEAPPNHKDRKKIEETMKEATKYLRAYKSLLDDFPDFREHEFTVLDAGTSSVYIKAKYQELRGKPLE